MNLKELLVTTVFVILAIAVAKAVATKLGLSGIKKLLPGG